MLVIIWVVVIGGVLVVVEKILIVCGRIFSEMLNVKVFIFVDIVLICVVL